MKFAKKKLKNIKIGDPARKNLGSINDLIASIKSDGLLQPIGVNEDDVLLFGYRRFCAFQQMGEEWIECAVIANAEELATALRLQETENTQRLDYSPSEKVELGRRIEVAIREAQKAKGIPPGAIPVKPGTETVNLPVFVDEEVSAFSKEALAAARSVDMSPTTYAKAKKVVNSAKDYPDSFGDLVEKMDKTGEVAPVHREMNKRKRKKDSLKDAEGTEVPAGLRDIFGDPWATNVIEEVGMAITKLKSAAMTVKNKGQALRWMAVAKIVAGFKQAIDELEDCRDLIDNGKTYVVCKKCKGDGKVLDREGDLATCTDCHGHQYLPEWRHQELYS